MKLKSTNRLVTWAPGDSETAYCYRADPTRSCACAKVQKRPISICEPLEVELLRDIFSDHPRNVRLHEARFRRKRAFLHNMDTVNLINKGNNSCSSSSEDVFERFVEHIYESGSPVGKNGIRWIYLMLCVYDVFQRKFYKIFAREL